MATEKNAPKNAVDEMGIPTNFDNWAEEQTGYAPYWSTDEAGKGSFLARVIDRQESEDFTRYMLQAGHDIKCYRGPADEAEEVTVKKGEFFTISVYYSLQGLFDFYLTDFMKVHKTTPWMKIEAKGKTKTKTPGRQVIQWKVMVPPEVRKQADQLRAANASKRIAEKSESSETEQLEN